MRIVYVGMFPARLVLDQKAEHGKPIEVPDEVAAKLLAKPDGRWIKAADEEAPQKGEEE